jgi:hypothetical protein
LPLLASITPIAKGYFANQIRARHKVSIHFLERRNYFVRKIVKQPSTAAEAATAPNTAPTIADDMLEGAEAIAAFLGFKRRQVFHIVKEGRLPVFHLGNKIFARKSTLVAHLAALEVTGFDSAEKP